MTRNITGYVPLGSRSETISSIKRKGLPPGYGLRETRIASSDNVSVSALIVQKEQERPSLVLLYLQGNAGNPLHRIPVFSTLLDACDSARGGLDVTILAPAPRSYWLSTNRTPTQRGITDDYLASIRYAIEHWPNSKLVIYGHSLGGSAAVCLLSKFQKSDPGASNIRGLIIENPFSSIPDMVRAMYPQRWLPYRYLAELAWDKWNVFSALADARTHNSVLHRVTHDMLVLLSEKDEVVPREMGERIVGAISSANGSGSKVKCVVVKGALHENAWQQLHWSREMVQYLRKIDAQT